MSNRIPFPPEFSADDLQVGDIILTSAATIGSVVIQLGSAGTVSHAVLYAGGGIIIEAMPGDAGVREYPLDQMLAGSEKAIVLRRVGLTPSQGLAVVERARSYVGRGYDMLGAVASVAYQIDRFILCPIQPWIDDCNAWAQSNSAWAFDPEGFFCSELVAKAFEEIGMPLTDSPSTGVSPATLMRLASTDKLEYLGMLKRSPVYEMPLMP
ncbi:MAG: hypothetical protein KDK70_08660 [Myxococcales bacterium]|nr:hypothetical protein [Myxococcales bacterium]